MKKRTYAVIGLGKFGYSVAETLAKAGCEVLAVDGDNERIQAIAPYATYPLCADVTEPGVMESLDFSNIDVAVIGISENMEASIITTLYAKEAGVPHVLVKANGKLHAHILKKIGADEVIFPEHNTGVRVAKKFISGGFKDYFELSDEVSIVEMPVPSEWVGKTLVDLNLRGRYGINVIAVGEGDHVSIQVDPHAPLRKEQVMGMIGTNDVLENLRSGE